MPTAWKNRFSPYRFDRKTGNFTQGGLRLRIENQPKTFLLLLIVANANLVRRFERIAQLRPGVDRHRDKAVTSLSTRLEDDPHRTRSIKTLRGPGFRLLEKTSPAPDHFGR